MDIASLVGVISGVFLIITAILIGGSVHNFFNLPGFMVVFGGTIAATFLTFQIRDVLSAFKAAFFVFSEKKRDPNDMVSTMISLCYITRREGIIKLAGIKTQSSFLKKVCNLIADGSEEELFHKTMAIEMDAMKARHFMVQDVFKKMGLYVNRAGHGHSPFDHFLWLSAFHTIFPACCREAEVQDTFGTRQHGDHR
jgi:chemotaxis protein MotA